MSVMMMSVVRRLIFVQLVLVLVSLFFCPSKSELSRYCTLDDMQHTRGVCGPRLSQLVATLCQGRYNPGKRSMSDEDLGVDSLSAIDASFIGKRSASSFLQYKRNSYLDSGHNYQQGIVCECCVHQCNIREIMEYCRPSSKRDSAPKAPLIGVDDGNSFE